MKIERTFIKEMTIGEFAEKHDLTMSVNERPGTRSDTSFYAQFKGSEVSKGSCLYGTYGNGSTPEEAIANYAIEISEQRLIFNAMRPNRIEIVAPRFIINN